MARIVKNGVSYTVDAATLTSGSSTVENSSGHLEVKTSGVATSLVNGSSTVQNSGGHLEVNTSGMATDLTNGSSTLTQTSGVMEVSAAYVRGDTSTGGTTSGIFRIYSGTADPATLSSLGQNGDIYLYRTGS